MKKEIDCLAEKALKTATKNLVEMQDSAIHWDDKKGFVLIKGWFRYE